MVFKLVMGNIGDIVLYMWDITRKVEFFKYSTIYIYRCIVIQIFIHLYIATFFGNRGYIFILMHKIWNEKSTKWSIVHYCCNSMMYLATSCEILRKWWGNGRVSKQCDKVERTLCCISMDKLKQSFLNIVVKFQSISKYFE